MEEIPRPLLVYDGDCGFCRRWIERWRRITGDAIDYAPFQVVAFKFPEIGWERFRASVVLIRPDGTFFTGAEAVFRSLAHGPGGGFWLSAYRHVPGFAWISEAGYHFVSGHRDFLARPTNWILGEPAALGSRVSCWLFLRALAVVYIAAFASLAVQITGLAGHHGILPIDRYLPAVSHAFGAQRYWLVPTLSWWNAGDGFLRFQCVAGVIAGILLLAGFAPILMLALLWVLYLSVSTAGQEFLWFQWDILLLEAGFLAIFLAPPVWWSRPGRDRPPPTGAIFLIRWLLFRLMFCSFVVKLASGDPTWRHLTALQFHYETQPLPPWTAWYMFRLPRWFHTIETFVTLVDEGIVPLLILGTRRVRAGAAFVLLSLQIVIILTGNYGFFNLLTMALCLPLLDDGYLPGWLRRLGEAERPAEPGRRARRGVWRPRRHPALPRRVVFTGLFLLSLVPVLGAFTGTEGTLPMLGGAYRLISPLHLVNGYGLFAVMTTTRNEIVIEGSDDGSTWKPYEFRWKPGNVKRNPEFMTPHMPRLDWQMWFAALALDRPQPWLLSLCARLLEGSQPVLGLLKLNPFPNAPPRFVRARVYDYQFTDPAERRETGAWWKRQLEGEYLPALTLRNGVLSRAD